MTIKGGVIEQKSIGINIGTDGTFSNTELVDGKIQLKINPNSSGEYYSMGIWTSKVIDIGDSFKEYGKILITQSIEGASVTTIRTRTSSDGVIFSNYADTELDGSINSPKNRFIQVSLILTAGYSDTVSSIELNALAESNNNVELVDENGVQVLRLKKSTNYQINQSLPIDEGVIYRQLITNSEIRRIDKLIWN